MQHVVEEITASLRGEADDLADVPLALDHVPPFARRVYEVVRTIPAGETLSYGEVAFAAGSPGAARAVGQALGRNPFPIVVPCHRVLAAGGRIGGFTATGGTAIKTEMLALEGITPRP
jgi:methylated-DNA-[protein]-cysteine S-methyltransferase